jgi:hypothetical protein
MRKLLFTALLTLGAGGAFAATEADWANVDTDGDGQVSLQDMQAVYPDTTPEIFRDYDANKNGSLDREEFLLSMPASELNGMYNIRPRQ